MNSVKNNFLICSNTNTVKVFNNFLCLDCKSKNSNNTSLRQKKKKEKRETDSKHFIYTSILCEMAGSYFDIYIYVTSLPLPSNLLFKVFNIFHFFNESNY